jgi:hypothetical protein
LGTGKRDKKGERGNVDTPKHGEVVVFCKTGAISGPLQANGPPLSPFFLLLISVFIGVRVEGLDCNQSNICLTLKRVYAYTSSEGLFLA